jgi:hypothetical protein
MIVLLAGCGDDDDDDDDDNNAAPTATVVAPEPSEDVTAGAYADEWNAMSESLDVDAVDSEAPSTDSGNWQLRFDPGATDADQGWLLMQEFGDQFDCELPERPPRDDVLVINC